MAEPIGLLQPDEMPALHDACLTWYEESGRNLPWRAPAVTPWHVLVSEFMLQQTPVNRVLPVYREWVDRWPTPAALAAQPNGEAVRAWGRLGYPRRALRLHSTAVAITERHAGAVPDEVEVLRTLPGVGEYTAAAVATFAFGQRHAVLDTNVRRVLGRVALGSQFPNTSVSIAERRLAEALLPADRSRAARWAVAVMELGALRCTAAAPQCATCPVRDVCNWRLAGYPEYDGPRRRTQRYDGTDRQCRGRLLQVLRDSDSPVSHDVLAAAWPDQQQRERALNGLVTDGLIEPLGDHTYALPGGPTGSTGLRNHV